MQTRWIFGFRTASRRVGREKGVTLGYPIDLSRLPNRSITSIFESICPIITRIIRTIGFDNHENIIISVCF